LESLANITSGVGFPPVLQGRTAGDYPLAKVGDVSRAVRNGDGTIGAAGHWVDEGDLKVLRATPLPAGSIVFAKIGEAIRQNFRALTTRSMIVDNNVMALVPHRDVVDERFLLHFTRMQDWYPLAVATTVPSLRKSDLGALLVPVAPLNEQRRIVVRLEALQTCIRRAREALEAVPPLLGKLRQSILAAAFRGDLTKDWRAKQKDLEPATEFLKRIRTARRQKWEATELAKLKSKGKPPTDDKWKTRYREPEPVEATALPELPDGWCWASLDELAHVGTGATPKRGEERYYQDGTIAWVTSGALNDNAVTEATELVTEHAVAETNLTLYPVGTLLLAMYGEGKTRGMVSELRIEATTNQAIAAICMSGLASRLKDLVKLALWQNYAQIRSASMGGVQPNLNLEKVRRLAIPLCPLEEAGVLQGAVDAALTRVNALSATAETQRGSFDVLERALLAKAFRGELVPQDPNDEPAEAMLARARSANGSAPGSGTTQKRGRPRSSQRADQPND
jgi:type I restriction enzyme S subunit